MIENRLVATAKCDACGHTNYSDDNGFIHAGYGISIVDYGNANAESQEAYACRLTHIGKAAKAMLCDNDQPPTPALDAPPLPVESDTP